jgi:hypothetical protein
MYLWSFETVVELDRLTRPQLSPDSCQGRRMANPYLQGWAEPGNLGAGSGW